MAKKWRVIPTAEAKAHPLYGVGGWLLLLVTGMMALGPLLGAGCIISDIQMAEDQYPALASMHEWKTFKFATWSTFIAAAALSFYGGLGLARGNDWSAVKRAEVILWISGPGAPLILGVLIPIFVFGKAQGIDAKFLGALISSVIAVSTWSAYLSKSQRVRVTFERSVLAESSPAEDKSAAQSTPSQSLQAHTSRILETPTSTQTNDNPNLDDSQNDHFYEIIAKEFNDNATKQALWLKAFAIAEGDENVAKAKYIKFRVAQLTNEHN